MKANIIKMFIIFVLACGFAYYLQNCSAKAQISVETKMQLREQSIKPFTPKIDYTNL